jgi:hypothetical protein
MTDHLSVEQQDHDAAEPKSVSNHKGNVARGVVSVIRSSFCSKIPLGSSCPRRSIQRTCCQTESSRGMTAFALGAASAAGPDFSLALAIRTNREARFHRVIITSYIETVDGKEGIVRIIFDDDDYVLVFLVLIMSDPRLSKI